MNCQDSQPSLLCSLANELAVAFSPSKAQTFHVLYCHLRYLLYDVNPPEGFNLRRDVYIRMASLVKTLRNEGDDWVLVLPPWGRLYHWQSPNIYQIRIPWGEFFSLTSLQANVPVIEYEEFIAGELFILSTRIPFSERFSFIVFLSFYTLLNTNGCFSECTVTTLLISC